MEAGATASGGIGARLDAIEGAVDTGDVDVADFGKLGFWRLVAVVKRDRVLVEEHADQIGRIDTAAFRAGVRLRAPVWAGNLVMLLGIVLGGAVVWVALAWCWAAGP